MWRLRQSVDDDQGVPEDRVECIEPANWMIRLWVAAVEAAVVVVVAAVVVYVHGRDTVGSGEWLFCRMEMVEAPVVKLMAESIGSTMDGYKGRIPEQIGVDLLQAAYEAWDDGGVAGERTVSELEVQSGWEESRLGQQKRSSLRRRCYWRCLRLKQVIVKVSTKRQISDPAQGNDVPTSDDARQT